MSNWSEEIFLLVKLKIQYHGHMLLMILMVNKLLAHSMKKNYKLQINNNLELKRYLKERVINYMSNGKVIIIHLIVGLIKKMYYENESIFS